jgi:hypothetical protein
LPMKDMLFITSPIVRNPVRPLFFSKASALC